ncbi:DUF445 domain-containing protein [Anaerospora hongkongensis]|uniref:DUF445 domain-containing protein n=1 Tax=Anaerospora hongkongensis TaxID=244830 RepID=UPI002FDA15C5
MRYRIIANRVLLVVLCSFGTAAGLKYYYGDIFWINLFFHITEASLVGGLADWFAVTALFEKPLGIPWHTALIPRNREKTITAIVNTIEQELVSAELVRSKIEKVRMTKYLIEWVDSDRGKQAFASLVVNYIEHVLDHLDKQQLASHLTTLCKDYINRTSFNRQIKNFGRWALAEGKDEQLLDVLIAELIELVNKDKGSETILNYLKSYQRQVTKNPAGKIAVWFGERTDSLNLEELAEALQQDVTATLLRLQSPRHPIRRWARKRMFDFLGRLEQDQQMARSLEEWKQQVVLRLPLDQFIGPLVDAILSSDQLSGKKGLYHSPLLVWGLSQAKTYWDIFKSDQEMQDWLDKRLQQALVNIIEGEHSFFGVVARDALSTYSEQDISRFIEEKVGDDLAWIRINGSVVGAVVGLVLFLFLHFIYDAYVVPVIRGWIQ